MQPNILATRIGANVHLKLLLGVFGIRHIGSVSGESSLGTMPSASTSQSPVTK